MRSDNPQDVGAGMRLGSLLLAMSVHQCGRRTQEELAFLTSSHADQRRNSPLIHNAQRSLHALMQAGC